MLVHPLRGQSNRFWQQNVIIADPPTPNKRGVTRFRQNYLAPPNASRNFLINWNALLWQRFHKSNAYFIRFTRTANSFRLSGSPQGPEPLGGQLLGVEDGNWIIASDVINIDLFYYQLKNGPIATIFYSSSGLGCRVRDAKDFHIL